MEIISNWNVQGGGEQNRKCETVGSVQYGSHLPQAAVEDLKCG